MRRLKYPVEVNRSKLQAISGPNTWPQLLAVLDWLVMLVHLSEDLVTPLAECQFSIVETGDRDDGDHHLLRTLHENYTQFLVGKDELGRVSSGNFCRMPMRGVVRARFGAGPRACSGIIDDMPRWPYGHRGIGRRGGP